MPLYNVFLVELVLNIDSRYPRKTLFDEDMIYREIPPKFSKQLVLHRFERTVHHVPFFRGCSDEVRTN